MKLYPAYRSTTAKYSRLLGNLAIPVGLLAVVFQRFGMVEPVTMLLSVMIAAILGWGAICLGLVALAGLWSRGGLGYASAIWGVLAGVIALAPVIATLALFRISPPVPDLATNPNDPPQIEMLTSNDVHPLNAVIGNWFSHMSGVAPAALAKEDGTKTELQRELYPDIVPRRYRIPPARLHAAVYEAAKEEGWALTSELPPDLLDAATRLQLESRSPVLGFTSDVAVRIRPDPVGALMDIRSVSRVDLPDLVGNSGRIRKLLARVDAVLLSTYGDLEQVAVLEEEEADEENAADTSDDEPGTLPVPGFKPYFEGEDTIEPEQDFGPETFAG